MKKNLLIFISIITSILSYAEGYKIQVDAPQLSNDSLYLAGYFNGRILAIDTIVLDKHGKGKFKKDELLNQGLYMLYLSPANHYDFIVGEEQHLKAKIDTTKIGLKIEGSTQSEMFVSLGEYMTEKRAEQISLKEKIKAAGDDSIKIKALKRDIEKLDNEVVNYQKNLAAEYKGKTLGLFIKSLITPQFPEELINGNQNDTIYQKKRYIYAKEHYWDNIDLSDVRSWRLNLLNKKLKEYLEHVIIRNPDSITNAALFLIESSKEKEKLYKYDKEVITSYELMVNYMIQYSVKSSIMGIDKLLVALADRYYFTGQAPWADSTIMANITSEVKKVRYNLIGMKAANLPLIKYDGDNFNIYDIKAKYTLLFFYEPTCGHCREMTPKIHEIYKKYKSKGFEVISIYLMTDKKEWKKFIEKQELEDWMNAWDPHRRSYYWRYYDTSTTPGIYLLDENKKIIAKKIDTKSIDKILDIELNKKNKMSLIKTVRGFTPKISEDTYLADNATIIGDVTIGKGSSVWFNSVIRGDVNTIKIGDNVNIQDGAVLHTLYEKSIIEIGDYVSIGHNVIIHGAKINDYALIGMGATILDNAEIGEGAIIAAGSVVLNNTKVEANTLWAGVPAKFVKKVDYKQSQEINQKIAHNYAMYANWFKE